MKYNQMMYKNLFSKAYCYRPPTGSGGFASDPHQGCCPWTLLGTYVPQNPSSPITPISHCILDKSVIITAVRERIPFINCPKWQLLLSPFHDLAMTR